MRSVDSHVFDLSVRIAVLGDGPPAAAALEAAVAAMHAHQRQCDRTHPASELARLNQAGPGPVPVSPLLLRAVRTALEARAATAGLYDPIETAANPRRTRPLFVDVARSTVELTGGAVLNLDQIALGLAVDAAAACLRAFPAYRIDAGPITRTGGSNPEGGPWQVAIPDPAAVDHVHTWLSLQEGSAVTIQSPGAPRPAARGGITSVTVIGLSACSAEVLARTALAAGPTAGRRLLDARCVAAILLTGAGEMLMTERIHPHLSPVSPAPAWQAPPPAVSPAAPVSAIERGRPNWAAGLRRVWAR